MKMGCEQLGRTMTAAVCAVAMMTWVGGCKKEKKMETVEQPVVMPTLTEPAVKITPEPAVDPAAVLVSVGSQKLTVGEADKQIVAMLGPQAASLGAERLGRMVERFRPQAADRFVVRTLLDQEADRRKLAVKGSDVDEAIAMIRKRIPAGSTLEEALASQGVSEATFRSNLVGELRLKMLVESEVPTNVPVADTDIAAAYEADKAQFVQGESVQARHILVKVDAADDAKVKAEKKTKAEALRKQLAEGGDFAKLAKENSDCPSKERGGDLGTFQRGQMVKAFEDAAFTQPVNAIGPVVETQFGYHIVQVTDRQAGKTNSLNEVKATLGEHLKQRKQMELFEAFIAKLKGQATITYSDLLKKPAAGQE